MKTLQEIQKHIKEIQLDIQETRRRLSKERDPEDAFRTVNMLNMWLEREAALRWVIEDCPVCGKTNEEEKES